MDILVDDRILSEMSLVASCSKLPAIGSGLPLIRPNRFKRPCRRHAELRMNGVIEAVQAQPKTSDTRKKLGNRNLRGHVSPIAAVFSCRAIVECRADIEGINTRSPYSSCDNAMVAIESYT